MEVKKLLDQANAAALALCDRLQGHTLEEKRLIAVAYMCGYCDGNLTSGQGRKTEQSGENART